MPELSIIIPTFNEERTVGRLLQDLRKQTYSDYEIIVADCSEDKTVEVAERFGCRTASCERKGPARNRNAGAEEAGGNFLLFLDADVRIPDRRALENLMSIVDIRNIKLASFYIRHDIEKGIDKLVFGMVNIIRDVFKNVYINSPGFAIFISKDLHDRINGFNENLHVGEDHDYVERASRMAKFHVIPEAIFIISSRRFEEEGRLRLFTKYLYCELYRILEGEVERKIYEYEF